MYPDPTACPMVYDVAIYREDVFLKSFEIANCRISEAKLEALEKAKQFGFAGDLIARIIEQDY